MERHSSYWKLLYHKSESSTFSGFTRFSVDDHRQQRNSQERRSHSVYHHCHFLL